MGRHADLRGAEAVWYARVYPYGYPENVDDRERARGGKPDVEARLPLRLTGIAVSAAARVSN